MSLANARYFVAEAARRPVPFLARRTWQLAGRYWRWASARAGRDPYAGELAAGVETARGGIVDQAAIEAAVTQAVTASGDAVSDLTARADRILDYDFSIFARRFRLSPPIDWHSDQESGVRWPLRFHGGYRYAELVDLARPTDIKVPWELSRLQDLLVVALAHRLSGDDRYLNWLEALVADWVKGNPVGYGINWTVGMEASLRAISLVLTAELLGDRGRSGAFADLRFRSLLAGHGRFIFRNLEFSDINGNHYTICLLGLLILGRFLPDERESPRWVATAIRELRREILRQTYPDGVCHEGSIPYHRLVFETFLVAALVCRRGDDLGAGYLARLERMAEFCQGYLKPGGTAPVWGDADDGRVVKLGSQGVNDHRYLLAVAGALFRRRDFVADAGPLSLDAAVLLDRELLRVYSDLADLGSPPNTGDARLSEGFAGGGFFVLRGGASYCLVDCGDVGLRGRGGHGHNDALSVELVIDGREVLTDTGSSAYTRSLEDRRYSLSATSHNVAVVDGAEPAPLSFARWPHATACPVEVVRWDPANGVFVGRSFGYVRSAGVGCYERRIEMLDGGARFAFVDLVQGRGSHRVRWYFHLAEEWSEVRLVPGGAVLVAGGGEQGVAFHCDREELILSVERKRYYPTYGAERWRWCLIATAEVQLPFRARFEFGHPPGR